jgi:SAM-dependent methyltransferase
MDFRPVRDAYSSLSEQYIALFDDDEKAHVDDRSFIRRHLTGLPGAVLDVGCGPGHWTAYLHSLGVRISGIDLVPAFVDHARTTHPGPEFRLASMTEAGVPAASLAGLLTWYSTIHLPPADLAPVLVGFRRLLVPSGTLVIGFFDSDDEVAPFDHAVVTAYRWPADVLAAQLAGAGFTEVERRRWQSTERPDRRYAAIAARAA